MNRRLPFSASASRRWPRRALALLGVLALGLWAPGSEAGPNDLLVIVNAQNPVKVLTASQLRPIFQTTKRKWENGELVEPVNLPEKSLPRQTFDKAVLGFDPETSLRYWIDRKVRGEARPPKKLTTPAAVVAHVSGTPGGIGYVPAEGTLSSSVRVVARVSGDQVKAP
jgi:ABC-type phosphate transport system substrate-binding protein